MCRKRKPRLPEALPEDMHCRQREACTASALPPRAFPTAASCWWTQGGAGRVHRTGLTADGDAQLHATPLGQLPRGRCRCLGWTDSGCKTDTNPGDLPRPRGVRTPTLTWSSGEGCQTTTPSCFFYPQKKLRYSAQICPRKAPIGSESQDWYPNLQLPLGPLSQPKPFRSSKDLKGTPHMTDLRWLPGASSHRISITPLGIEDSLILHAVFLHWGKLRMEEDRPCPGGHGPNQEPEF